MKDFVESYQEAKQEANEAKCESAKYTCEMNCQNGNYAYQVDDQYNGNANEYCAYQCLVKQGKITSEVNVSVRENLTSSWYFL